MQASGLRGKMIKNYSIENSIATFSDPFSELAHAVKDNKEKVSIYAVQKRLIDQQSFIAYQNSVATNEERLYPKYEEIIQSANYIYLAFQSVRSIWECNWNFEKLIEELQDVYKNIGQSIIPEGIVVDSHNKMKYFPSYRKVQMISKMQYDFQNKSILAEIFCKLIPLSDKAKAYELFVKQLGAPKLKKHISKYVLESKHQSPAKLQDCLYPSIDEDDEQIFKLMSVVRINPELKQEAGSHFIRASSRARHEDHEETKEIKNIIEEVKQSMFDIKISKGVGKSKYEIRMNERKHSQNEFQLYFTSYVEIFKLFKQALKSFLSYFKQGYSGVISAYFITLIGIMRRTRMVYHLTQGEDIFNINVDARDIKMEPYIHFLKKQLLSEAKILTDLRDMIFRCYIPMKTMEILGPFLDDSIENVDHARLEDFCFFFMTSLMKSNLEKNMHFIYQIEFMYIILNRNYEIVHFSSEMPKKWDASFFELRKELIQAVLPKWKV